MSRRETSCRRVPWWRHQMETFSALLTLCAGNSPVTSEFPKGWWCGALMFSLICAWINGWVNNCAAGDLRRHRAHYDGSVMAVIARPNITWVCACYKNDWGKIRIRGYIHKRQIYIQYISPSRASYGVSFVRTWVKIDRVITAPYCIFFYKWPAMIKTGVIQRSAWWLQITWRQISTSPSLTVMLIIFYLHCKISVLNVNFYEHLLGNTVHMKNTFTTLN